MFPLDRDGVLHAPALSALSWVEHGFGTRASRDWPGERTVRLRQVHSARVVLVGEPWPEEAAPEADAMISRQPGAVLAIRTADCLPILIADERNHACAAVHAGWKGTVAGIAVKTIAAMRDHFGSEPEDIWVAIGPGIGQCCFEVGPEVSAQFARFFPKRSDLDRRTKISLVEANRAQLVVWGVREERIAMEARCTRCEASLFHSWRRDGTAAGRMIAAIGVR